MLKIAICDDEIEFVNKIKKDVLSFFLDKQTECQINTFTDPNKLLSSKFIENDIIFLDVEMGDYSGIDIARAIRKRKKTYVIIYISSFIKYAVDSYSVRAFYYLLKNDLENTFVQCMQEIVDSLPIQMSSFTFPTLKKSIRICDIVYIESNNHFITIHTQNGDCFKCYGKLSQAENILEGKDFLRLQQSFLANMHYIIKINSRIATLKTGEHINCRKENYQEILQSYMLWKGAQ